MFKFSKKERKEPEDISELLERFNSLKQDFKKMSEELENLKKSNTLSVQKVGIVRFNPFSEVGSDQSFSIALLDGNNCGVVITSLYGREENRIYGKPIIKGESQYVLSNEEKEAIEKAKNQDQDQENKADQKKIN